MAIFRPMTSEAKRHPSCFSPAGKVRNSGHMRKMSAPLAVRNAAASALNPVPTSEPGYIKLRAVISSRFAASSALGE